MAIDLDESSTVRRQAMLQRWVVRRTLTASLLLAGCGRTAATETGAVGDGDSRTGGDATGGDETGGDDTGGGAPGEATLLVDFEVPGVGLWALSGGATEWHDLSYDGEPSTSSSTIVMASGRWEFIAVSGSGTCASSELVELWDGDVYRWIVDSFPRVLADTDPPACEE